MAIYNGTAYVAQLWKHVQANIHEYVYIYIYVCVCERHCIKCYVYISYGSYKFTKPWNLVQKGPCIFIPKQKGPCMIISKQKGA